MSDANSTQVLRHSHEQVNELKKVHMLYCIYIQSEIGRNDKERKGANIF